MKKYILTLIFALSLLFPLSIFAQESTTEQTSDTNTSENITTETTKPTLPAKRTVAWNPIHIDTTLEFNLNSKQEPYISYYLWFSKNTYCGYTRFNFLKLEGDYKISAGEAAVGRTVSIHKNVQGRVYLGGTTEGKVVILGGIVTSIKKKPIVYAVDIKIATRVGTHSELTQNLAIFLDKEGLNKPGNTLKFKIDTLRSENKIQYFRVGLEKSKWVGQKAMVYIGSYYDPIQNNFGISTGIRASLK